MRTDLPMSGRAFLAGQKRIAIAPAARWVHAESMARKSLRCWLGWHKWVSKSNEDGTRYIGCARCPKQTDDPGPWGPIPG
ncbi:hypothetical protein E1262_17665 [Jiangella aurantiaca]|uniref:Uncharacterized protein n=1 Tax=Jiangella aurantiaca TaxID=2530373 RepID=A0A4R5ADB8_9ACTN|nr:hypothetical protein E1262_17665 [Jiangella aurantiaca]